MKPAETTHTNQIIHHFIISFAFFIASSSQRLRTIFNEPNTIEKIAHKAKKVAILFVHPIIFDLNQPVTLKSLQVLTKSVFQSQIHFSISQITFSDFSSYLQAEKPVLKL